MSDERNGLAGAASWFRDNPLWLLILLFAGIGTPTSIGSAVWLQNNQTEMALHKRELDLLQERVADLNAVLQKEIAGMRAEVNMRPSVHTITEIQDAIHALQGAIDTRVTRDERMEMLRNLERTDGDLSRRIDLLHELLYGQQPRPGSASAARPDRPPF